MNRNKKHDPILDVPDEHLYLERGHNEDVRHCPIYGWPGRSRLSREQLDSEMPLCCRCMARRVHKINSEVARVLNQAGIACVLWEKPMLDLYGVHVPNPAAQFVIADEFIDKATEVLCKSMPAALGPVTPCPKKEGEGCRSASWNSSPADPEDMLPHRVAYTHLHTELSRWPWEWPVIRLYKQSLTLWAMSPLSELPVPKVGSQENVGKLALALGPDYTLASHPRFIEFVSGRQMANADPYGRYPADLHPVVAAVPERALEAILRIYGRYSGSEPLSRCNMWMDHIETHICAFLGAIKKDKIHHFDINRISPEVRIMVMIALGGNITLRKLRRGLREILGEPPNDDRFAMKFLSIDDERFSTWPPWRRGREHLSSWDKLDWDIEPDKQEEMNKKKKKKEKKDGKYWLDVQKKD